MRLRSRQEATDYLRLWYSARCTVDEYPVLITRLPWGKGEHGWWFAVVLPSGYRWLVRVGVGGAVEQRIGFTAERLAEFVAAVSS